MMTERQLGVLSSHFESITVKQLLLLLGFSVVSVFTIPQFIIGVAIFSAALTFMQIRILAKDKELITIKNVLAALSPIFMVILSKLAFDTWPKIQALRAVPYPEDVRVSMGNVDPPEIVYQSISVMIQDRFFSFWPNGLSMGYPGSGTLYLVVAFWISLLAGISYINSLGMLKNGRWGPVGLALVVSSISFSVLFDIQMATPPPVRYGFAVVIVGCLLLADEYLIKPKSIAIWSIGLLIAITYVLSYRMPPLYTEVGKCEIGADRLISCKPIDENEKLPWP